MIRAPHRSRLTILGVLLAAALVGCANPAADRLLIADAPPNSVDPERVDGLSVWAVEPGEDPSDATLVTSSATNPLEIATLEEKTGRPWVNNLGREWEGSVLVGFGTQQDSALRTLVPGTQPNDLVRAQQLRTTVLRRGAFVATDGGCSLATSPTEVDNVGSGSCTISSDERWVVSFRRGEEGMSVRDLRNGQVRTIDGVPVNEAVVLSADARILVTSTETDRVRAVLFDARNGSEVARTQLFRSLQLSSQVHDATGFLLQTQREDGSVELLHMDTDGELTTVDTGPFMVPLTNAGEVTYLHYGEDLADSSLRRWSPGGEPEVLLEGYLGAAAVGPHHVIAFKETDDAVELYRQDPGSGEMRLALSLPLPEGDESPLSGQVLGVSIPRVWVKGKMAYLQLDRDSGSAFVRLDLRGDHSDAPIEGARGLRFESLDKDGTAVLTRVVGEQENRRTEIVAIRPSEHEPDVRATFASADLALIHKGRIYFTDGSDPNRFTIRSVRASGSDRTVKELYVNKQLAGGTWPEFGGATASVAITPRLLITQRQQQLDQQQAADAARAQALEDAQQGG